MEKWHTLEQWVTLGKIGHTVKNGWHVGKWVTLGKIGDTQTHGSLLENWITLGKKGYTEKWATFCKDGSHLKK